MDAAVSDATGHPSDAGATGRLGMVLHAYQQLDLAELCYRRAHLLAPDSLEWAYYLTVVEQTHGELEQAVVDGRAAVKIDPSSRPARMRLADALLQGHQYKESREIYEKLIREEPDLALYHYGLGKVLAAQGGYILEAIAQFQKACALAPTFSAARYALAMGFRDIKDLEQASRELAIYQQNPASMPPEDRFMAQVTALNQGGLIRAQAAEQYLSHGRPAEAAKELETAVSNDPGDEVAHSNLVAIYWELKQFDKAEQHYRIAVKLNPNTTAHYVFGLVLLDQNRYAEAGDTFRRALAINPRDNGANTQLGRVLELRGDMEGAIRQYQVALESDPNSRATNYVLGVALLKQGQAQSAVDCLLKTLQPVDEKTPGYMRQLAQAYRKVGDDDKAKYYEQLAGKGNPPANALAGQAAPVQSGAAASNSK